MESKNSQRMIGEAIRKIALGRSIERINLSQGGTSSFTENFLSLSLHGGAYSIRDIPQNTFVFYGQTMFKVKKIQRIDLQLKIFFNFVRKQELSYSIKNERILLWSLSV